MTPLLLILILVAAWFIFHRRDSFSQNMYSAREKMPWMDAIVYEEVRAKLRENKFNPNDLKQIFTV